MPDEKTKHIHSFKNPFLVTDTFKISKLTPTLRNSLFALFQSSKKTIIHDKTKLNFDSQKYLDVWSPSIDTILVTKALLKTDLTNVKSAVEISAGSRFIAKFILEHSPNLERIELIDLNHHAMDCWMDNIKDERAKFFIGDASEITGNKKYNLVVCNPPYIPRPKSFVDNPYEGMFLIKHLIEQAKNMLTPKGKLILNFSSLSKDQANEFIKKEKLNTKTLESMDIPLKVYNVLNNPEWIKYLEKKK